MRRTETKFARLEQIKTLLLSCPEGLTQAEIARRLGVHRSTVQRMLPDLEGMAPVYTDERGRLFIDREADLLDVTFNLHEALAVHLAARLLAARLDRHNPHAASALRKLAEPLRTLAPHISDHLRASAAGMDAAAAHRDPRFLQALEKLTLAWAAHRCVRLWYRKSPAELGVYTFCPYTIEPYADGHTTYTVGMCRERGELRTFKIERIERIELLREEYALPEGFNTQDLFGDAWGIWFTGQPPVEVVLRFSPAAAGRVLETRWHRSEQTEPLPGGRLLWRARVAEPQEMLPWIRGWGADVEVLEPEGLREKMVDEAKAINLIYNHSEGSLHG